MATNPNPYEDAFPWGNIVIGGVLLPGIIEDIDGCEKPHRWVFQMGLAVSNSVSIWRGQKLAEDIKITMRLYGTESFAGAYLVRNALQPRLGRRPPVLPILNGAFNFVGIKRVSVLSIPAPKPAGGLSWSWTIRVCEYNPMKPVPVGPPDAPKAESENDRKQKVADGLWAEVAKLNQ
jgi:hypothetical protein